MICYGLGQDILKGFIGFSELEYGWRALCRHLADPQAGGGVEAWM